MSEAFQIILLAVDSAIRLSVPLLFACLAGLYSERAGVDATPVWPRARRVR